MAILANGLETVEPGISAWRIVYNTNFENLFSKTEEWITDEYGMVTLFSTDGYAVLHKNDVIFDHTFAKSIYGKNWEYNLQMQVIAKSPLKYMWEFVNKQKGK